MNFFHQGIPLGRWFGITVVIHWTFLLYAGFRIFNSAHDADEFMQVFDRMAGYYPGSTPLQPQRLVGTARRNLGGGTGNESRNAVSRLRKRLV